jgi:hypothetical protein
MSSVKEVQSWQCRVYELLSRRLNNYPPLILLISSIVAVRSALPVSGLCFA